MKSFTEMPKSYKRSNNVAHYRWMAEHEGQRTLRALEAGAALSAYHHARDAGHWAIIVADLETSPDA